MKFSQIRAALTVAFQDGWTDLGVDGCAVEYENGPTNQALENPWARFLLRPGTTDLAALGDPNISMNRTIGLVVLEIFVPKKKGTELGLDLAGKFSQIFNLQTFAFPTGEIVMRTTSCNIIGEHAKEGWLQVNAFCPFCADSFDEFEDPLLTMVSDEEGALLSPDGEGDLVILGANP